MWPFSHDKKASSPSSGVLAPRTLIEYVTPWLALLELYRGLGRRQEFEAVAYRVHFEFNVRFFRWAGEGSMEHSASLEDFPHVLARLIAVWGTPECAPFLNSLVGDNRGGIRVGFPEEAFREVLLLLQIQECEAGDSDMDTPEKMAG